VCLSHGANPEPAAKPTPDAVKQDAIKQVCEDIVNGMSRGDKKVQELGALLLKHWGTFRGKPEEEEELGRQRIREFAAYKERCGEYLGCELVEKRDVGSSLCRYVFVAKYELHVVRWSFVVYRARNEWKIIRMFWDGSEPAFSSLFDATPARPNPQSLAPNP
jgi:hypothetical protein